MKKALLLTALILIAAPLKGAVERTGSAGTPCLHPDKMLDAPMAQPAFFTPHPALHPYEYRAKTKVDLWI